MQNTWPVSLKKLVAHNWDKEAHPNGFTQCVKITSTNTNDSPTENDTHKDMGDVSFLAKNGTVLGNVGVDLSCDNDGTVFRSVYLQALSDTTDQSKHATIALKNTLDGTTKVIHSDATLQTVATDRCTATDPEEDAHIANKKYVDNSGRPDYSNPTAIYGATYSVPANGYIQCYVELYKSGQISINGLVVFKFFDAFAENSPEYSGSYGNGGCAVIPVSKGDVLSILGIFKQLNFLPYK